MTSLQINTLYLLPQLMFFYNNAFYKNTEARLTTKIRTRPEHAQPRMGNLKNNNNVIFEIQQCDSFIEIYASTQLPILFWRTNSEDVC